MDWRVGRVLLVFPAGISLLAALDAGLFRMGWRLPLPQSDFPMAHGPLMVCGFLGTLIGLEKAVALGSRWALLGPALSGAGGLALVVASAAAAQRLLFLGASLVLVIVAATFFERQPTGFNASVLAGALAWLSGNMLWLAGWPLFAVVPAWIAFLLLAIAGERLELNRLLAPSGERRAAFATCALAALSGVALIALGFSRDRDADLLFDGDKVVFISSVFGWGVRLLSGSMFGFGAWLLASDMARAAVRKPGLSRFMGVNLLLGYGWLTLAGAIWLSRGTVVGGNVYDAILHAFFLGFAFSMIFAHGPVIFPAIFERSIEFHPAFYAHTALLHLGLAVRVAGDLADSPMRPWGGLINALAIVVFLANTLRSVSPSYRNDPKG